MLEQLEHLVIGYHFSDEMTTPENSQVESISRKDFFLKKNPQRLHVRHVKREDTVRTVQRCMEAAEMTARHLSMVVTAMSVIPCRLIDGLHEWCNEISTVPD